MFILGIETSCDDTGAAVVEATTDSRFIVHANVIKRQDHTATGGVVPEIAARHHAQVIVPAMEEALQKAKKKIEEVDCIAVTKGPGLMPCLLVGVEAAKTLAVARELPIIGVNHMEAHIASTFVEHPKIAYPTIVLLASGGHTMLVKMTQEGQYQLLGTTRDDAAGEAFDKVAKMLELPYPGGPAIAQLAAKGDPEAYDFPKPMVNSPDFDFSFAGLKTALHNHLRGRHSLAQKDKADIAASFQESIIYTLVAKTLFALEAYDAKTIIVAGGVSANVELQRRMKKAIEGARPYTQLVIPSSGLFTDNGAMIAIAAAERALRGDFDDWRSIRAAPQLKLA